MHIHGLSYIYAKRRGHLTNNQLAGAMYVWLLLTSIHTCKLGSIISECPPLERARTETVNDRLNDQLETVFFVFQAYMLRG